jgi:hypothetical protein
VRFKDQEPSLLVRVNPGLPLMPLYVAPFVTVRSSFFISMSPISVVGSLYAFRTSVAAGFEAGSAALHVNLPLQDFNWTRDRSTFHRLDRRVLREWNFQVAKM